MSCLISAGITQGFTAGRLRFNIIIGHLLCCLHCFEGFMSGLLTVQYSCKKGLMSIPEVERLGMETVELRVTLLLSRGGGRQTFKRAYCCSFHSGFDCLCFDLVWGGHVVQCYPPIISAISETLQWKRHWLGLSVSPIFPPLNRKHESPYLCIRTGEKLFSVCCGRK